ncbi:hypothetical protein [Sphingomonas sp. ABOLH]|uniref:hypothetical protein n=1 Tax=Sphingomonas sp. ABOLH TaxID=1985881 RepID=UPI0019CFA483|nr:hypothetical protein [Sphingomonas sp. ABOLH]
MRYSTILSSAAAIAIVATGTASAQRGAEETGDQALKNVTGVIAAPYQLGSKVAAKGPMAMNRGSVLNAADNTITLPLRRGRLENGDAVWYIVTEASDLSAARQLGTSYAPSLSRADARFVRSGRYIGRAKQLIFAAGGVDFSPARSLTPGDAPNFFPPKGFTIGAKGDHDYTPLTRIGGARGYIVNAPTIAYKVDAASLNAMCDGNVNHELVHDRVVKICPKTGTVTLQANIGLHNGRSYLFISTESNADLVSVLEAAVYAPRLAGLPVDDEDTQSSYVNRNFVTVNGQTGASNPQRQGINSAISDGMSVLDVFDYVPGDTKGYSPLWDIFPVVWNDKARVDGAVKRLHSASEVRAAVAAGYVGGLNGKFGPGGFNVNCPIVYRLN